MKPNKMAKIKDVRMRWLTRTCRVSEWGGLGKAAVWLLPLAAGLWH